MEKFQRSRYFFLSYKFRFIWTCNDRCKKLQITNNCEWYVFSSRIGWKWKDRFRTKAPL